MPTRDPRWLTRQQVADLLGVHPTTVWRLGKVWRETKAVRLYQPATEVFYWRDDVERYVRERGGEIADAGPQAGAEEDFSASDKGNRP